jgi:hypothetical protein
MKFIDEQTMAEIQPRHPEYDVTGRSYLPIAAAIVTALCGQSQRAIEIGPYVCPLVSGPGVDYMDIRADYGTVIKYQHPAHVTPWPIESGLYDLSVAMQVFEHLPDVASRRAAFGELRRVATHSVISLPWLWQGADEMHAGINIDYVESFITAEPVSVTITGQPLRQHMVLVF